MKKVSIALTIVLTLALSFGTAFSAPSAKVTAQAGEIAQIAPGDYNPIFTRTIKTAEKKDLLVDVSLECGLTTNTMVMSKLLQRAISQAEAAVYVKVIVDDDEALPGEVVFAKRYQAQIAEFAGDISGALSVDGSGALVIDYTLIDEEMLALILKTMSANSFNFIAPNLEAGEHTITVMAKVDWVAPGEEFTPEEDELMYNDVSTKAYMGKGSVTVESVRAVKTEDFEL